MFIRECLVLGIFDNTEGACLKKEYIDIQKLDINSEYQGKNSKIRWHPYKADWANLKLNMHFPDQAKETGGNAENACAYLLSYIISPDQRKARLQILGSPDSFSLWLNKEELAKNFRIRASTKELASHSKYCRYRLLLFQKEGKKTPISFCLCQWVL